MSLASSLRKLLQHSKRSDVLPTEVTLASNVQHRATLLALEEEIFLESGYGDMTAYEKYIPQSRILGAYRPQIEKPVGVVRLIAGKPLLPPFFSPVFKVKERKYWESLAAEELLEELGTVAVEKSYRGKGVGSSLYKAAYQDSKSRGITHWVIVMEPWRVWALNIKFHGTFRRVGKVKWYMGGFCAPHVMILQDVEREMSRKDPATFSWFTGIST